MKRCPKCERSYTDETLNFCLEDGEWLVDEGSDEAATAILGGDTAEHPTRTMSMVSAASRKPIVAGLFGLILVTALGIAGYIYYGRSSSKQISSIAVMPFVNDSGNADVDYLSDGITETLISSLSQIPNLNVKARSSVFRYKGKELNTETIGKELNVQAILNGHVVQHSDRLAISAELIDVQNENVIWSEKYDRKQTDLISLQSDIARDVSQKLRTKLSGADEQKVAKSFTANPEAYQLYLKGRYFWNKREAKETEKAIEFYQQAIDHDPNYALAYAGLAECYITAETSVAEQYPKVTAAAQKAIEVDPTLGEPHAALANITDTYDLDYPRAEQEFKRAIELSPHYATGHHWYGEFLAMQGRFDESFAEYRKALEIDPYSLAINTDLGMAYRWARQYDRAIEHLKKLEEMDPNYERTPYYLAAVYQDAGRFDDATAEFMKALGKSGFPAQELEADRKRLLDAVKKYGPVGYWKGLLEINRFGGNENVSAPLMAAFCARAGQRDEALKWLEKSYENHEIGRLALKVDAKWDNLRSDTRFIELMKKIGFSN